MEWIHAALDSASSAFDKKYGGDVAKSLSGAEIRITGKLQPYRGRPEIIINRLDQLEVMKKG